MSGGRRPAIAPDVAACALAAFLCGTAAAAAVDAPAPVGVIVGAAVLTWLAGPLVLYLDLTRVRGRADWTPRTPFWLGAWALPPVNVLAGVGYLYRRHRAFRGTGTATARATTGRNDGGDEPWHRYAAGVLGAYPLFALALVAAARGSAWPTLGLVASLAWLPFGLAFAPLAYLDLRTIPDRGVEWGPTRYLYLSSAVSPSAAVWYLLRRTWKVYRARPDDWRRR